MAELSAVKYQLYGNRNTQHVLIKLQIETGAWRPSWCRRVATVRRRGGKELLDTVATVSEHVEDVKVWDGSNCACAWHVSELVRPLTEKENYGDIRGCNQPICRRVAAPDLCSSIPSWAGRSLKLL